jgi:hypothetical protein
MAPALLARTSILQQFGGESAHVVQRTEVDRMCPAVDLRGDGRRLLR